MKIGVFDHTTTRIGLLVVSQKFKLGAVLSVTTGYLLCEIGELYEILNFLTKENLYTHQLPRAAEYAKVHIAIAYPGIEDTQVPKNLKTIEQVAQYLKDLLKDNFYQEEYELEPMENFPAKGPIEELLDMRKGR